MYTDATLKTEKLKGQSHATNEHYYTKVDGVWKFAGLKPKVRINEFEFEKVFKGSYKEDSSAVPVKNGNGNGVHANGNGVKA